MYIQNPEFELIAKSMIKQIEEFKILKNDKFNVCIGRIANAVCNPLKISYIKKDKIESLLKHANIRIPAIPTAEQRDKYFNACTLRKFANHYFITEGISSIQLEQFNNIVTEATAAANLLLPKTLHILNAEHIPQIYNFKYNNENNKQPFNIGKLEGLFIGEKSDINSSCMQGKPESYFEIYNDINTDENTLKMAILTQGNEIVARSLVWIDKPEADIDRRKKQNPKHFFIDRIYCKTQDHRAETQKQLYKDVIKYFNIEIDDNYFLPEVSEPTNKINFPRCYNADDIRTKLTAEQNTNKDILFTSRPLFDVELNQDAYNFYPYLDTFQYFNTYHQTLSNDQEHSSDILRLDNVSGEASNSMKICEHCGQEHEEEETIWIETEGIDVCQDCATFCDERDEYILTDEAVYNNYSGTYHYRGDLDH